MLKQGGVTSASGFKAFGDHVGLKKKRKDLAIVVSDMPAHFAATFTTNLAKAAPILWNQKVLAGGGTVKAIVVNSGQANACTGQQGAANATAMAEQAAVSLGCESSEVVLASTGIIGLQIPIVAALQGISYVASQVRADEFAGSSAAEAITTTDSYVKQCAIEIQVGGVSATIGAMAKGSGMIHPNMATMLSFITTDVAISPALLQKALKLSVNGTYNMISVDGDTSTNDMVAMLANGAAGNVFIDEENDDFKTFCAALNELNYNLARKIAADADGATKRLSVNLYGADSEDTGRTLARTVVSSNLVKASLFAEEPNWGRIVVALGYAGVVFNMEHLAIEFKSEYGSIIAVEGGQEHSNYSAATAKHVLHATDVEINIRLKEGDATATAWGCDLRHDYIRNHNHTTSADQEGQPSGQIIDNPVIALKYADAV